MLLCLGIESTAHTFGIGIVREDGKILANERIVYTTKEGGIHPREAAEFHAKNFDKVLLKALDNSGILIVKRDKTYFFDVLSFLRDKEELEEVIIEEPFKRKRYLKSDKEIYVENQKLINYDLDLESIDRKELEKYKINLIAVSKGPGLYPTLVNGIFISKVLALKLNVPLVGVNHCVAHVEITKLVTGFKDPVVLYVSGANTQVIAYEGGKYRIFGETLDMGVGNFLDSVGRLLGLGFPAGPKLEELAKRGKNLIELPYTVKGMDIQLGGIYTYIKNLLERNHNISKEDLAFSVQEHVFAMLVEVLERAVAHLNKEEVVLTGGVAANRRLREMVKTMAEERKIKFKPLPFDLATDNGAMIAWTGILWYKKGYKDDIENLEPDPYWRTDQVEI